jgi:DNA-binding response OmpR family regulator
VTGDAALRVLLVEDDRELAGMLERLLTSEGYRSTWPATVSSACTGR